MGGAKRQSLTPVKLSLNDDFPSFKNICFILTFINLKTKLYRSIEGSVFSSTKKRYFLIGGYLALAYFS